MIKKHTSFESLMEITDRPSTVFVEGHGSWLKDSEGKEYLDFLHGWAVNCLGHCHPAIVNAITSQAARLINPSAAFYNEPMIKLADLITQNSCFDKVFFANSGAEANEGAIKLARKWGSKFRNGSYEIITTENAFHGRTLCTMSASGKPHWQSLYEPKVPGFPKVPLNDIAAIANAITDNTVAVMLEPIQGEAGVIEAKSDYLKALHKLTREKDILLIFDEIQTGMGRIGQLFAYEHYHIEPDIMTLGKGIGSGVPLAAMAAKNEICCFEPGDQGGTFNGNPLMTAVGCAVMEELLKPGFLEEVSTIGAYLKSQLEMLSEKYALGEVRGKGLLLALNVKQNIAPAIAKSAMQKGLLLNAPQPSTLRFVPALTVTRDEIDQMINTLQSVLDECQLH